MYEEEDDEGGADADGETEDIDKGKGFVAPEVPDSDKEITFKHRCWNGYVPGSQNNAMKWGIGCQLFVACRPGDVRFRYSQCTNMAIKKANLVLTGLRWNTSADNSRKAAGAAKAYFSLRCLIHPNVGYDKCKMKACPVYDFRKVAGASERSEGCGRGGACRSSSDEVLSSATLGWQVRSNEERSALGTSPLIVPAHMQAAIYHAKGVHWHKASARVSPAS